MYVFVWACIADLNARAYAPVTRAPRAGRERPADERGAALHALYIETPSSAALVADQSIVPALEQHIQNLNAETQVQHQYIKLLESESGDAGEKARERRTSGSVLKVVCNTGNDARTEARLYINTPSSVRKRNPKQKCV